ncbi:hypothetical protein [Janthinobacterium sp. SUN137]|uniref:hypothetical protein n=1 Tax=Janthinobacterium sp. SUN137 TaxID=3014789 RepID=UPI002712F7EE|nr:hypothetical protein [Janthinobacterium sp. SUN137]MDO8039500.1 hypothetical protein [Janthinobacterium sp. SUN137]
MNIETIRVVSPESSENPLGFIIINRADFDSAKHEPFGDDLGTVALAERVPTMAELLAARDQLAQRAADLDAEDARLKAQAETQAAEAQRLIDEAAAQVFSAKKPGIADLRDALTSKGITFDPAASKADLQVLLDAAA